MDTRSRNGGIQEDAAYIVNRDAPRHGMVVSGRRLTGADAGTLGTKGVMNRSGNPGDYNR